VKTELAGRGVGLDVVRANLNALNGEIDIQSTSGKGTKFTLKVPLTLIILRLCLCVAARRISRCHWRWSRKSAACAPTKSKTSAESC